MVVSESVRNRLGAPARLPHRGGRVAALAALVLATALAPAFAQQGPVPSGRFEPQRLRRVIEERYRVVPLRDGVALVPRRESRQVQSVELSGDTVAINGVPVTGAELRDRLGSDSEAILALSYLDPDSRRALFNVRTPAAAPEAGANRIPRQPAAPGEPSNPPVTEREAPPQVQPPSVPSETRRDETTRYSDTKVHIGGGVQVGEGETVDGPVVAIGGSVVVNGEVREDVVAVGGGVRLGPKARVSGDVTAVGGSVQKDPQAEVDGKINEIGLRMPHVHFGRGFWLPATGIFAGAFRPWVEVMATLFRMVLFGLLAFLVFLIARSPVERIERAAAVEPWKAGLVGIFAQLLFVPVFVLTIIILAISIVGIPLLLFVPPLAILAFIAALIVGFTGVAYRVGRTAQERFGWAQQPPSLLLLVGLLGIWVITIGGRMMSLVGGPAWAVATALLIVGFLVEYVAWTVGLGAAVMTRFGTRSAGGSGPLTVPPPAVAAGPQGGGAA